MNEGMIFLLVFWVAILCSASYFIGRAIFRPLKKTRTAPATGTQFQITDFYVLLLQLGTVGLLVVGKEHRSGQLVRLVSLIVYWLFLIWWWWLGIRILSHAGVKQVRVRAVILGVAVPFAFGGCFLPLPLIDFARDDLTSLEPLHFYLTLTLFLALVPMLALLGSRRLVLWAITTLPDGALRKTATHENEKG